MVEDSKSIANRHESTSHLLVFCCENELAAQQNTPPVHDHLLVYTVAEFG
jgi:hypothetical protein